MKTGGYKVYPQEIERLLGPDCVVLGFPSTYWGEIITVAAERPPPGWEDAARAATATLSAHKRPRFHCAVATLPRNGQGKIVRRQLLAHLQAEYRLHDGPRPTLEKIA
jgi:acyl-CoA synthetase (AMP-forming)/AMP-acid ligase II